MATEMEFARGKQLTTFMRQIALEEDIEENTLCDRVARGTIVILGSNKHPNVKPIGIGKGLRVKVSTNIGISFREQSLDALIENVKYAAECGSDAIMDLTCAGNFDDIRRRVIASSNLPVGSCPAYQVFGEAIQSGQAIEKIPAERFVEVIQKHAEDGVSFMGLHCNITHEDAEKSEKRLMRIVSRGGALMYSWMSHNNSENPILKHFDTVMKIFRENNVVLDPSDCLRAGCIHDSNDPVYISGILTVRNIVETAHSYGVGVMIEGPGHMPLNEIESSIKIYKKLTCNVPMFMLGPTVIDVAVGYDHIVGAIGGAVAGYAGADILCTITPAEHIGMPNRKNLEDGIYATRIAAFAADTAKMHEAALEQNRQISKHRRNLNWNAQVEYALTNKRIKQLLSRRGNGESCSMCGKLCPLYSEEDLQVDTPVCQQLEIDGIQDKIS